MRCSEYQILFTLVARHKLHAAQIDEIFGGDRASSPACLLG
jgi:hypothetical protein